MTMFVKPAPGLKVRHPISKFHIPDSGIEVPEESYWLRRLADGDVIRVESLQIPDSDSKGNEQ
jgi:hypothetical protein